MITIKEVAKLAKTSRGTVDRVIHQRGKVAKEVEKRVMDVLIKTNYRPNSVARSLAFLNNQRHVGVIIGSRNQPFFDLVEEGIRHQINKVYYSGLDFAIKSIEVFSEEQTLQAIEELKQLNLSLLIISTIETEKIKKALEDLDIPIIALNINLNLKNKLAYVGPDYLNSGKLLANIANLIFKDKVRTSIVISSVLHNGLKQRLKGLIEVLNHNFEIVKIYDNFDSEVLTYKATKEILENESSDLIFFLSAGFKGANLALSEFKGKLPKIITVDQTMEVIDCLKNDLVIASVGQHPFSQGKEAINLAYDYLIRTEKVKENIILENTIFLKESLISHT